MRYSNSSFRFIRPSFAFAMAAAAVSAVAAPNADRPDARHAWAVHDGHRPNPPQVLCEEGEVPSDAIVLFDGTQKSIDEHWSDKQGNPTKWVLKDNLFYCVPKSGMAYARDKAKDFQLHVEFMIPDPPGPGLGNTGVYVHGKYELQVLHSYFNMNEFHPTPPWKQANYADGEMGAVYGQTPPLVTACRKAGHWQVFDIVFHPAYWEGDTLVEPARLTAFLNGVLIQDNVNLEGPTFYCKRTKHDREREVEEDIVVAFQDHGHPCPYRNVWYRPIPSRRANTVHGGDYFNAADALALRKRLAAEAKACAAKEQNLCNRIVFLWESYCYEKDEALKKEIDELTPKYIEFVNSLNGEVSAEIRQELSNIYGFCTMGVRNGLFGEDYPLLKAVDAAGRRTATKEKHY